MKTFRTTPPRRISLYLAGVWLAVILCPGCASGPTRSQQPAPPAAPAKELPGARVLFLVIPEVEGGDGLPEDRPVLMPLACQSAGRIMGGQLCLGTLPNNAALALEGGEVVYAQGRSRPYCEGVISRSRGLALSSVGYATYAVWPPEDLGQVHPTEAGPPYRTTCRGWCNFGRTGHPRIKIPAPLKPRLSAALAAAKAGDSVEDAELVQTVDVDLDGDGTPERFYSVVIPDPGAEEYSFSFSALYLSWGKGTGALRLVRRADHAAVVVRGTLDLDGDGTRELWLLLTPTSSTGVTHEIQIMVGGRARLIGGYQCHPMQD